MSDRPILFALALLTGAFLASSCSKPENPEEVFIGKTTEMEGEIPATAIAKAKYDESKHVGVPEAAKQKWLEATVYRRHYPHSYRKPLALLDEAIKIYPQYQMAYYTRGTILLKRYNDTIDIRVLDRALASFRKCLELGGDWVGLYNNLAFVLILKGENEEAIKYLQKALEMEPNSPFVLNNLFQAHFNEGKFEAAKSYLDKAMKIDPHNSVTKHNWIKYNSQIQQR